MKNLIQAAVVTLFAASAAQAQQAVQWKVSDGGNGHWYRFEQDALHWQPHQDRALASGAYLATVTSASEKAFVESVLFVQEYDIWLGGRSNWPLPITWVTGEPFSYTQSFWCSNNGYNPGGGYAIEICGRSDCLGQFCWNVESEDCLCWPGNKAVYEWSADCNSDGIVDYGQCNDGTLADYNGNNIPDCCERGEACVVGNYPVQWRVEDGGNGHWYSIQTSGLVPAAPTNWDFLNTRAMNMGASLCSIGSAAENDYVRTFVSAFGGVGGFWCYLGGVQDLAQPCSPVSWNWNDGTPWSFSHWQPGQPDCLVGSCGSCNEPRMAIRSLSGEWGDWNLRDLNHAVLEWSADCNNDGIVDYGQIVQGQLADLNADGVPDICQQPTCQDADLFANGLVNGADLGILLSEWGPANPSTVSDITRDGVVDGADLGLLLSFWGACS